MTKIHNNDRVTILLVDDQPAKLLAYEVILKDLDENLVKAASAREALEYLLRRDVAVILIDVSMPELDGFQLAAMVRDHPRFQRTAIIFVSAIHLTDMDRLRGYEMGAVDYVPVPVIPEVLRAKVRVFAELYRKTRDLEQLNRELEGRVAERTAELEASTARLVQSERLRSLALAAGQMGTWDWEVASGTFMWDEGQYRIFGVDPNDFQVTVEAIRALIHPEDWERLRQLWEQVTAHTQSFQTEFRVIRPSGELRWCMGTAAARIENDSIIRLSGVTVDITDRKEAEERQALLAREVDHRARNALAVVQSIVRLSRASSVGSHIAAVEGRIRALAHAHTLLSESRWQGADLGKLVNEELAPYRVGEAERVEIRGAELLLEPAPAQTLALVLHELATNAAKYGALSVASGRLKVNWEMRRSSLMLSWIESGGPPVEPPTSKGYGTRVIRASIERQLGGSSMFDWRPDGLRCSLTIPTSEKLRLPERPAAGARNEARPPAGFRSQAIAGNRILLVEDEALVAMAVKDALSDLGFEVIGAVSNMTDAMAAAMNEDVHAAVLDINLAGKMTYPVADILIAKGVPFIFVTGYGAESVKERFGQVPVLQKPFNLEVFENAFVIQTDRPGKRLGDNVEDLSELRRSVRSRGGATTS